jgi:hypothetical protein
MLRAVACALCFLVTSAAVADELIPSTWKNTRGSVMSVVLPNPGGGFLGSYVNNAPDYPQCRGVPYPLWGKSDGKKLTFTVLWSAPLQEDCESTTTWTGTMSGKTIRSKFVIYYKGKVLRKGRDTFTRQ